MAYSINPNLPKARAIAMRMLISEKLPLQVVANRCGIHRSTVWRWKRKWNEINENVQLKNLNRPNVVAGKQFRQAALKWLVPTLSSRPHTCSHAIGDEIVRRIMELRHTLKRCAEVIWHHLTTEDGVQVSLSSVRRIPEATSCLWWSQKEPSTPRQPKET